MAEDVVVGFYLCGVLGLLLAQHCPVLKTLTNEFVP